MQSHAIQFMANYGRLQPASPKITTRDETVFGRWKIGPLSPVAC